MSKVFRAFDAQFYFHLYQKNAKFLLYIRRNSKQFIQILIT